VREVDQASVIVVDRTRMNPSLESSSFELGDREYGEAVDHFAGRLELFAASLPAHERDILVRMILAAMDPMDRLKHVDTSGVLSAEEEALIRSLRAGEQQGR
jgi:hypothetical protein